MAKQMKKDTKMNQDEFYLLLENLSTEDRLKFFESSKGFFSKKKNIQN